MRYQVRPVESSLLELHRSAIGKGQGGSFAIHPVNLNGVHGGSPVTFQDQERA